MPICSMFFFIIESRTSLATCCQIKIYEFFFSVHKYICMALKLWILNSLLFIFFVVFFVCLSLHLETA